MGKRAQERRAARDLARHVVEKQIEPQLIAAEMRAQGRKVEVTMVNNDPDADGVEVTCYSCGRTAKMATAPPEGKVVTCPTCTREMHG